MKKLMSSLGILLTLTLAVACSSSQTGEGSLPETGMGEIVTTIEKPVTIEFWHALSGTNEDVVNQLVEDFNSTIGQEKNITVVPVYQGSYNELKSKTTAAIKAKEAPVLAQSYTDWVAEYLQADVVVPLNDYIMDETVGITDFEDIAQAYRDENSQFGDKEMVYSLPFNKSSEVLYYNKTFFDENNLMVPTTWEEVEEVAKQIYDLTGKPGFGIDSTQNYMVTAIRQLGGEYTGEQGEVLFGTNDAALKALERVERNTDEGYWRLVGEDRFMSGPFLNELVYMYIGSTAVSEFLKEANFEWGASTYPQVSNGTKAVIQQGTNVVVMNQNKTPEEVYAGYEFAKYLCSVEANTYVATNTGYLPIRSSVIDSEAYQTYVTESNDDTKTVGPQQIEFSFYDPAFFTGDISSYNVRAEIGRVLENVVVNNMEAQEAIDEALRSLQQ